jgi:O-antigen/teichoic acid export membrane protein
MSQPDLKSQVTSGALWNGVGRVVQQIIQFGLSVLLARLLSPGDYGLMAMVMVFTSFAGMLADAGFNTALVQRKDINPVHGHTVFWITLLIGVLLLAGTFALAPFIADFYQTPALTNIFRVISINFVIGTFGNVPSAILQREMRFREIAKIETIALLLSGALAIGMALRGAGVWSLVAQPLLAAIVTALLRCRACRWFPKMVFCPKALKEIWGFSGHMFGFLFINYWSRNADNLIIGKFFGSVAVGLYSRAYGLMLLPITQINGVINQIMLPALCGIQDDKPRVARIYLRMVGLISLLSCPMMLGLFVVADSFVLTVYGEKWRGMVPVLQVLSLVGLIQSLVSSCGLLLQSQGRSDLLFYWWSLFNMLFIGSFVAGGLLGSVYSVAVCYAVANILYSAPALVISGRAVDLPARKIVHAIAGPFFAALGMASAVYAVKCLLPASWPPGLILVLLMMVGIVSYAIAVLSWNLTAWQDMRKTIRGKMGVSIA